SDSFLSRMNRHVLQLYKQKG
ncbi:hypothetical protein A5831_001559, partial [Enterococcus faecium]